MVANGLIRPMVCPPAGWGDLWGRGRERVVLAECRGGGDWTGNDIDLFSFSRIQSTSKIQHFKIYLNSTVFNLGFRFSAWKNALKFCECVILKISA